MKKTKILILIPDGVGIKNYLYSSLFRDPSLNISLFHNFDKGTSEHLKKYVDFENDYKIPIYKESLGEKFLREVIHFSRLNYNANKVSNSTILKFKKSNHKSLKLKIFYKMVSFASYFLRSYESILKWEEYYNVALTKNPFYKELKEILASIDPNVIFCTHQRALKAPTIFAVAKELGIKTTTVIYSWDNLPKARLALKANSYFVWSKYMKDEMHTFYPEIPLNAIKVTGTPQFEFYKDASNIIDSETFYTSYNLNKVKKLICFSGDDIKTSPYDPEYLNEVAKAIVNEGKENEYQLIFRRCPVDVSGRYDWVLEKFPNLIKEIPPLWNYDTDLWTTMYPTYNDIKLLVSLAYYSDVVINVGSTMAFDFGMFKKPCIYINYDYIEDPNWSVNTIYKYQHFRSIPSSKAVYWFNSPLEIAKILEKALKLPHTEITKWMEVVVGLDERASENILKELTKCT